MRLLLLRIPAEIERFVKRKQTAGFIPITNLFQMQSNLLIAITTVSIYFQSIKDRYRIF